MKGLTITIFILIFFSCKKDNGQFCYSISGKGRIIGIDPCTPFTGNRTSGSGFVIEIDKLNDRDTVVTYNLPENLFQFKPEYFDASYSSFLFRPEIQNLYEISFQYRFANETEKVSINCNGSIYTGEFDAAVADNQIIISCISKL